MINVRIDTGTEKIGEILIGKLRLEGVNNDVTVVVTGSVTRVTKPFGKKPVVFTLQMNKDVKGSELHKKIEKAIKTFNKFEPRIIIDLVEIY